VEYFRKPSLTVGLLPRRALTGWVWLCVLAGAVAPTIKEGSVTQHSIIRARQFISLTLIAYK
jgi:hypothetical protein